MKAAGIEVPVHHFLGDFLVLVGDDALGAGQKADEPAVGVGPFGGFEDPGNDVVTPRRRPAREHDAQAAGAGLTGLACGRHDFQQGILAHLGQLLRGHLEDRQIKARQGPGAPRPPRQGRAELRPVGPPLLAKGRLGP